MHKVKHLNSGEEIENLPQYLKIKGIYGFLVLTDDLKVLFFYSEDEDIRFNDVSDDYELIKIK